MLTSTVSSGGDIFHRNAHPHSHSLTEIFVVSPLPHPHHTHTPTLRSQHTCLVRCQCANVPFDILLSPFLSSSSIFRCLDDSRLLRVLQKHASRQICLPPREMSGHIFFSDRLFAPLPLTQTPYPRQALPYPTSLRVGG